jgi:peptide deformylase
MDEFTIEELKEKHKLTPLELLENLSGTMAAMGGIGLSANQCGLPIRAFVMYTDFTNKDVALFMNPKIIWESEDTEIFKEGCLTFPGLFLNVKRPKTIEYEYMDKDGNIQKSKFTGLTCRIFQHEYDHMEGRNFTQLVSRLKLDMGLKKAAKMKKKFEKTS